MTSTKTTPVTSKIFLVDRDFQFKLALRGAAVGLISSIFGLAVVWYPLYLFERLPSGMALPPMVYGFIALAVLANIFAIVAFGIRISHRVAGPVYSIVRHMRRVEKGHKVTLLNARHSDELKYLVRNYNNLLVGLEFSRKRRLAILRELASSLGTDEATKAQEAVQELIAELSEEGLEAIPEVYLAREQAKGQNNSVA